MVAAGPDARVEPIACTENEVDVWKSMQVTPKLIRRPNLELLNHLISKTCTQC